MKVPFKLTAMAVLLAASGAVSANGNSVVLYGQVNVSINFDKNYYANFGGQIPKANDAPNQVRIDGESSRIGFKGTEKIFDSLSAGFLIETGINPDDATSGRFGSREAWVLVGGNGSELSLGRGKSLYTLAYEVTDLLYGNFSVGLAGYGLEGSNRDDGYGGDGYNYRVNNALRYQYESGPIKFGAEYATAENKSRTQDAGQEVNAYVRYSTDDWWLQAAINNGENFNSQKDSTLRNYLLGGGITVSGVGLTAQYQRHTYDRSGYDNERNSVQVTASYNFGPANIYAGLTFHGKLKENGRSVNNSKIDHHGFGIAFPLSKRTTIRSEYALIDFDTDEFIKQRTFNVAIYHSF